MFIDAKTSESTAETFSSTTNEYMSTIDKHDQMAMRLLEIEINSPINSNEDPDRKLLLIDNIMNLSSNNFVDKLEDCYRLRLAQYISFFLLSFSCSSFLSFDMCKYYL